MGLVRQKTAQLEECEKPHLEGDRDALWAALEHSNASGRRQAAREIAHFPDCAARLVSRLQREQDDAVREVILGALVRMNDPIALSGLVDCLRSEDAALRNEVIERFAQMTPRCNLCSKIPIRICASSRSIFLRPRGIPMWRVG
jgi:hypothetical protein